MTDATQRLIEAAASAKVLARLLSNAAFNSGVEDPGDARTGQERAEVKAQQALIAMDAAIDAVAAAARQEAEQSVNPFAYINAHAALQLIKGNDGAVYLHTESTKEPGDVPCFLATPQAEQAPEVRAAEPEPNMRHPKIQALIGAQARREIELRIAEDLLDDPKHEISWPAGDYWYSLHDKIMELQHRAQAEQSASEPNVSATEELAMMIRMLVSNLKRYWPYAPQPDDLPSRAVDLLRKYDLLGSPLRAELVTRAFDAGRAGVPAPAAPQPPKETT